MVAYESLKIKEKFNWVIPKVVVVAYQSGCLRELFITKFNLQFKWGFTKVAVTRADHLQEWSQGELRLYLKNAALFFLNFWASFVISVSNFNEFCFCYRAHHYRKDLFVDHQFLVVIMSKKRVKDCLLLMYLKWI